ncbi:MAG: DMT family transporter [Bacillota bacterium]|nr:DMT family transporter [Bacillota bacterium]
MNKTKVSHLYAMLVMIIWGMSYLSIKIVVAEINPILSAFYRFLIAGVILIIIKKMQHSNEKVLKEDRLKMALGGLFGVGLYFFFENYSIAFTTASNVAILIASIPIFTLIAQKIIFNEEITKTKLIGTIFSVVGIIIIVASKDKISLFSTGTIGDLMALACALCWVIYNIINSSFKGNYSSITITTYQSIWGCIFLSPSLVFVSNSIPSAKVILNILFLSVFCSCVGYVLYNYALNYLGATVLTTYINLQPIITLIAAVIILRERITISQLIGCFTIILGVSMVSTQKKGKAEVIENI